MNFSRLQLENWKNFRKADVKLGRRAFIFGPNASGKSNLLDAFRFLHDVVSVGGGFQQSVSRRGGVSIIRCLAARRYPDIKLKAILGNEDDSEQWTYTLSFAQDNQGRAFIKSEEVFESGKLVISRPDHDDAVDQARLTQTFLEQVNVNKPFRVIADFFRSIDYLHVVPQLIREPDRSVGKRNDPFGGDFLERLASATPRTRDARLERIRKSLEVAVPQLERLELFRDPKNGTPHLRGKYSHWRPQGSWQMEDQFSDGTLRLIGLLWATLDGSGPLLLEEPELSLHTEVVRYLPRMFNRIQRRTGRQVFVSTHAEEILRDPDVGPDEVLMLIPTDNGTEVLVANESPDVVRLFEATGDLAEAILPKTKPRHAEQLPLLLG